MLAQTGSRDDNREFASSKSTLIASINKFAGEKVTSTNPAEKVTAEKQADNWTISVNDFYFYVIPEAVIVGG